MPLHWYEDKPAISGTRFTDATWLAVRRLEKDAHYQDLLKRVRAVRETYMESDSLSRRLIEEFYWQECDVDETCRRIYVGRTKFFELWREIVHREVAKCREYGVRALEENANAADATDA